MRPGPAPTPTALRVLHGDRPSRINSREPLPREGSPVMPSWLTREARAVWRRTLRELQAMRVVTPADAHHLAMYCTTVAEYIAAAALVARDGLLVPGRDGGQVANPACRIERDRLVMAHRLGADLGRSPAARVSLASLPQADPTDVESLLS